MVAVSATLSLPLPHDPRRHCPLILDDCRFQGIDQETLQPNCRIHQSLLIHQVSIASVWKPPSSIAERNDAIRNADGRSEAREQETARREHSPQGGEHRVE